MNDNPRQLDAIEDALLELDEAERARVFDRTRSEPGQLLKVDPVEQLSAVRRRVLRWVPIAAAIGMVAVVGTSMFSARVGTVESSGVVSSDSTVNHSRDCAGDFVGCFTGPKMVALANSCVAYDYDGDSDVDMVDWSILDLGCKGRMQAHP